MNLVLPRASRNGRAIGVLGVFFLCLLASVGRADAQFGPIAPATKEFVDASGLFSLAVPSGWTYQPDLSAPGFALFYGPGDDDLFYVEVMARGSGPQTPAGQAQAAVAQYSGPMGLSDFALISPPTPGSLGGREASFIVYSYTDGDGQPMVEGRAFVVIGDDVYTLAFADAAPRFDGSAAIFNGVMASFKVRDSVLVSSPPQVAGFGGGVSASGGGTSAAGDVGGPGVYTSPGAFYAMTLPSGWELWEEQATAKGDLIEPWHTLLNWPGKPITKSLFIWDFFDEWLQTGAQYEIVAAVIENVPGTQAEAVDQLTRTIAGAAATTYEGIPRRVRLGTEAAFAVNIGVRPGRTELWSEGIPWHRGVTFYVLKRSSTLFVLAVPDEIVDSPELSGALQSFQWLAH